MKAKSFSYQRAKSLDEVIQSLASADKPTMLLAGGQSLFPAIRNRQITPQHIIDIDRVDELSYLYVDDEALHIGALCRHAFLERERILRDNEAWSVIAEAASHVAMYPVRTRGTIGGSFAYAHPAAELPLVALALGARVVLRSVHGQRCVTSQDFFAVAHSPNIEKSEIVVEISFPVPPRSTYSAFVELAPREIGWASAAACAVVTINDGVIVKASIAVGAATSRLWRSSSAEKILLGKRFCDISIEDVANSALHECEGLGIANKERQILIYPVVVGALQQIGDRL